MKNKKKEWYLQSCMDCVFEFEGRCMYWAKHMYVSKYKNCSIWKEKRTLANQKGVTNE